MKILLDRNFDKMYKTHEMPKLAEHYKSTGSTGMVVKTYTATEARTRFADVFDEAFYKGPVIVEKNSKSVAVISLALLRALTEIEAEGEAKQAQEALREFLAQGGKNMNDLRKELEID